MLGARSGHGTGSPANDPAPAFLAGGGALGQLIRDTDWSATPLGPPAGWPAALQTLVAMMLNSHQPMFVAWGPARTMLYNDGYARLCGNKHPQALAAAFDEVWSDILDDVGPLMDRTFAGEPIHMDDIEFRMTDRHGVPEETHFAFSYTPVRGADGTVAGVFCACTETTQQVLAERRIRQADARHSFLLALGDRLRDAGDPRVAMAAATEALGRHLGASRVGYATVDAAGAMFLVEDDWTGPQGTSIAGWHRLDDFGPSLISRLRAGETVVTEDTLDPARTDLADERVADTIVRTRIGASITVPLLRQGRLAGSLFVHDAAPRVWRPDEQALVRDVAERTWAAVERARAERAVRDSESRFRTMADHAPVMVWVTETDGRCTYLSRSWYEFTGQTPAQGLGFGWLDATHPDDRETSDAAFRSANAQQRPFRLEYRLRRADGSYRWAIDSAAPHFSDSGEFMGYIGSVIDIEDRKRMEQALAASNAQLQQADRRKDRFLATLAHELRNPLAPIRQAVRILGAPAASERDRSWSRGVIERQVQTMSLLLDDLLDVSRITLGKLALRREPVTLAAIVGAALETARPLIEAGQHQLDLDLPADPVPLDVDPLRLAQVFANLLTNAAKYTDPGGRIVLRAVVTDAVLQLSVRDTGIGIDPHHLEAIFEMFSQASGADRRTQGGLGIGLALVRGLVALHGGSIEARSAGPGCGSEFVVRLPLAGRQEPQALPPSGHRSPSFDSPGRRRSDGPLQRAPADRPDAPASSASPVPATASPVPATASPVPAAASPAAAAASADVSGGPSAGRRVLVADDNRDAAQTLARFLSLQGWDVSTAFDGEEALALAGSFRPEICLLDIGMPGLDGYEVARRLRARPGCPLLVALTGWGQDADRRRSLEAGFDRHLTKPVDLDALQHLLAATAALPRT